MSDPQAKDATEEELTRRCGHECLLPPDHDGVHQYGYILGPYSYEGLLAEVHSLREERDRLCRLAQETDRRLAQMVDKLNDDSAPNGR